MRLSIQVQFPGRLCLPHDLFIFFTVRKSSCRKVMFSQACVKNSVHRGQVYTPLDTHTQSHTHPLEIHPLEHTPLDTHLRTHTHTHTPQTLTPLPRWPLKQTVHILLECILVFYLHLIHLCRMHGVFTYAQISQYWHLCVNFN